MTPLPIVTMLMALSAAPEPKLPDVAEVRRAVERSLPYLEKEGVAWWQKHQCVTCHQMPMMFWSHYEAQKRGFTINQKVVDDLRHKVLAQMSSKVPTGDKIKVVTDSASILIWGMSVGPLDDQTKQVFEKYVDLFVQVQQADGSWLDPSLHWKGKELDPYPPLIESDATKTMYTLLAGSRVSQDKNTWAQSRDKALTWLRKTQPASHQELALRLIVAKEFGKADEVQPLLKQLLSEQKEDGGWSQAKDRPSDALATGQALVAIHAAGITDAPPAVRRAWAFLLKTQRQDGSWLIPTRNNGKPQASPSGYITSYFGTGWAVIGLTRTLPEN